MQERNSSKSDKPKKGDGTQTVRGKDANWFGASHEPQEEFIENDALPDDPTERDSLQTSEGRPVFSGDRRKTGDKRET